MLVEEQVRLWRILYVVGFLCVSLKLEVVIRWYAQVAQFLYYCLVPPNVQIISISCMYIFIMRGCVVCVLRKSHSIVDM